MSVAISDSFWFNMLWNNQCLNWFRQDFRQETPPHILQAARRVAGIALAPDAGPVVCPLCPSMSIELPSWKTLRILDLSLDQNLNLSRLDQLYPAMGIPFHCFAILRLSIVFNGNARPAHPASLRVEPVTNLSHCRSDFTLYPGPLNRALAHSPLFDIQLQ